MTDEQLKNFKQEIRDYQRQNIDEKLLMGYYVFKTYLNSLISFGYNNPVTKDCENVWHEFLDTLKEEKKIMDFLVKRGSLIDQDATFEFIDDLDKLNDDTVAYYYSVLDEIEDACYMKEAWRASRPRKHFKTLNEGSKMHERAIALTLSTDDIIDFLGFDSEYWNYISTRITRDNMNGDTTMYGVNLKYNQDILTDIHVVVPNIVNMETCIINIQVLSDAHHAYLGLGTKYDETLRSIRNDGIYGKNVFTSTYLPKMYKKEFKV